MKSAIGSDRSASAWGAPSVHISDDGCNITGGWDSPGTPKCSGPALWSRRCRQPTADLLSNARPTEPARSCSGVRLLEHALLEPLQSVTSTINDLFRCVGMITGEQYAVGCFSWRGPRTGRRRKRRQRARPKVDGRLTRLSEAHVAPLMALILDWRAPGCRALGDSSRMREHALAALLPTPARGGRETCCTSGDAGVVAGKHPRGPTSRADRWL
jgi:hypothetical protein